MRYLVFLAALMIGCAHSPQRDEMAKAREMWREGEAWRKTQTDFPPFSRQDRIDLAHLYFPPRGGRYKSDYRRGLALLEVYRLTGSERVYWRAVELMSKDDK